MGKGAKKLPFTLIFNAIKGLGSLNWIAIKNIFGVFTKMFGWVKDIFGVVRDVFSQVQTFLKPLWDFYRDYVKPALDFINDLLTGIKAVVYLVQGKVELMLESS